MDIERRRFSQALGGVLTLGYLPLAQAEQRVASSRTGTSIKLAGPYGAKDFGPFVFKVELKSNSVHTWLTHGKAGNPPHALEWRKLEPIKFSFDKFEVLPPFFFKLPSSHIGGSELFNEMIILARGTTKRGKVHWYLAIDKPEELMSREKADTLDGYQWHIVSAPAKTKSSNLKFISPFLFDEADGSLYLVKWAGGSKRLEWQVVARPTLASSRGPYSICPPTYYVPEKGIRDDLEKEIRKVKGLGYSPACPQRLFVVLLDRATGHTWFLANREREDIGADWLTMDFGKWQWASDIGKLDPGELLVGVTRPANAVDFGTPIRKLNKTSDTTPDFNLHSVATSAGVAFYVEDSLTQNIWCASYRLMLKTSNGGTTDGMPAHLSYGSYYDELFRFWCLCEQVSSL